MGEGISIAPPTVPQDPAAVGSGLGGEGRAAPAPVTRAPASASAPGSCPPGSPWPQAAPSPSGGPCPRNPLAFSTVRISCRSSSSLSAVFGPRFPGSAASGYTGPRALSASGPWIGVDAAHWPSPCCRRSDCQWPALLRSPAKKTTHGRDRADRSRRVGDLAPLVSKRAIEWIWQTTR